MKGKRKARYDFRESVKVRDGYNRDTNAARAKERSQASYDPENPIKQKRSDYKGANVYFQEGLKNPSIIHRIKTAVQTTTGKQIENRKERERKRRSRKRGR